MIVNNIVFPAFTGVKCNMMPFIQGDPESLPEAYRSYAGIVAGNVLEPGKVGFLTIDESFVPAMASQRGYSVAGHNRNVHVEVGRRAGVNRWGGDSWAGRPDVILDRHTKVLIANSISDTCMVWDVEDFSETEDGDLGAYLDRYPAGSGYSMKAGELARIGIFTPHECLPQAVGGHRQFVRIVGQGVSGRASYFTVNPLLQLSGNS